MSATPGLPHNKNQLSPLGFQFRVKKLPTTNFFITRTNLPGLTGNSPGVATPFKIMPMAYDKLEYGDLAVTFKVDEDMKNWMEIFDWMVGVGFPTKFDERKLLESQQGQGEGKFSDGTLTVMTSAKNPNIQFMFKDMIPYSLSDLEFTSQDMDVNYLEATVAFKYLYYTIERRKP
jgi:hypothetical protein